MSESFARWVAFREIKLLTRRRFHLDIEPGGNENKYTYIQGAWLILVTPSPKMCFVMIVQSVDVVEMPTWVAEEKSDTPDRTYLYAILPITSLIARSLLPSIKYSPKCNIIEWLLYEWQKIHPPTTPTRTVYVLNSIRPTVNAGIYSWVVVPNKVENLYSMEKDQ